MKFLIVFIFILSSLLGFAQRPEQYIKKAESAFENGNYLEAYAYYEAACQMDSSNFKWNVRYADCARLVKNYALAEKLYASTYSKDEGKLYPDGLYWLASMQKHNGKYEDAQRNFRKYLKKFKSKGTRDLVDRAEQDAKSALWALDYKEKPDSFKVETIHSDLNSAEADASPWFHDGVLYYSEMNNGIWSIKMKNWPDGQVSSFNNGSMESAANLVFDNASKKAFYVVTDNGKSRIVMCDVVQGRFENPQPMESLCDATENATMPCPAEIGGKRYLFYVSNRDGGKGGMDIWYVELTEKGLSKPKNLGAPVNTAGDELSPYFNNGLFFSSDFHLGFGGFDVFKSAGVPGNFSSPQNLGKAINTNANDFFFHFNEKTGEGWLVSNRTGALSEESFTTCCNDIFSVKWKVQPLNKKDELVSKSAADTALIAIGQQLPVRLYFHNDEPNPRTRDTTTTLTYEEAYQSYLKLIPIYQRENTEGLSGETKEEAQAMVDDFFELQVVKGFKELNLVCDMVLRELESGRSILLNVRGFASPRAESDYNLNLTKRRTASLVNYMLVARDGVYRPYMEGKASNGAVLQFKLLPFGEYKSEKGVSDDLKDVKKSIYSRAACLERKIEIESVEYIDTPKSTVLAPVLDSDAFDFGAVKTTSNNLEHTFVLTNPGDQVLKIDSVVAECGCTEPELDNYYIDPGKSANLHVGFHPFGPKGRAQEKKVWIYFANGERREITLRVTLN